jgi:hypothetical protein
MVLHLSKNSVAINLYWKSASPCIFPYLLFIQVTWVNLSLLLEGCLIQQRQGETIHQPRCWPVGIDALDWDVSMRVVGVGPIHASYILFMIQVKLLQWQLEAHHNKQARIRWTFGSRSNFGFTTSWLEESRTIRFPNIPHLNLHHTSAG